MVSLLVHVTLLLAWLKTTVLACDFVNGEWVFKSKGNNYICSTMCRCQEVGEICMRGCEQCCTVIKNLGEKYANVKIEEASKLKESSLAFEPIDILWILIGIVIAVVFTVLFQQRTRIVTLFQNCFKKVTRKSGPLLQDDVFEVVIPNDDGKIEDNGDIVGGTRIKPTKCAEESNLNTDSIFCRSLLRQVSGGS